MIGRISVLAAVLSALPAAAARAQPPAVPPAVPPAGITQAKPDDVMLVTQGWLLLSQGAAGPAADRARTVLSRSPASPGAAALAVEAEIARGGFTSGLAEYERLLGTRIHEEPLLLRRVSQALLREAAAQTGDERARLTALRALAAAGDSDATNELVSAMTQGNEAATRVLTEIGNAEAITRVTDGINARIVDPVRVLKSMSKTRNQSTVALAMKLLDDPRSEVRGAAIDALAQMRAREAAPRLRKVLSDERPFLRVSAAAALLAMGDEAGLPLIQELTTSESAQARLDAAEALAGRRDAGWIELVRALTAAAEPEIRVRAARLIAPFDPDLASSVLAALQNDANPAVRTLASGTAFDMATGDLRRLRGYLRAVSLEQRVLAAEKILGGSR